MIYTQLKPCPFCGGRAILTMMNDGKSLSGYAVACERTSIDCPTAMPATKFFASHDMAIREWNRRNETRDVIKMKVVE